jgi:hypothetical protein
LSVGEFAVVQAEVATGIVLTTDGQQRHVGSGEMYRIFPSLDSARAFARQVVTPSPKVECWIYDSEQTYIERIVAQS